jgi:hypothetical protein
MPLDVQSSTETSAYLYRLQCYIDTKIVNLGLIDRRAFVNTVMNLPSCTFSAVAAYLSSHQAELSFIYLAGCIISVQCYI